jgi:hypothetical protein
MPGAIPPLPQYAFMAWCLVKAQGQFYLYLSTVTFDLAGSIPLSALWSCINYICLQSGLIYNQLTIINALSSPLREKRS